MACVDLRAHLVATCATIIFPLLLVLDSAGPVLGHCPITDGRPIANGRSITDSRSIAGRRSRSDLRIRALQECCRCASRAAGNRARRTIRSTCGTRSSTGSTRRDVQEVLHLACGRSADRSAWFCPCAWSCSRTWTGAGAGARHRPTNRRRPADRRTGAAVTAATTAATAATTSTATSKPIAGREQYDGEDRQTH